MIHMRECYYRKSINQYLSATLWPQTFGCVEFLGWRTRRSFFIRSRLIWLSRPDGGETLEKLCSHINTHLLSSVSVFFFFPSLQVGLCDWFHLSLRVCVSECCVFTFPAGPLGNNGSLLLLLLLLLLSVLLCLMGHCRHRSSVIKKD